MGSEGKEEGSEEGDSKGTLQGWRGLQGIDDDNGVVCNPHATLISISLSPMTVGGNVPSCGTDEDNRAVYNPHAALVALSLHLPALTVVSGFPPAVLTTGQCDTYMPPLFPFISTHTCIVITLL